VEPWTEIVSRSRNAEEEGCLDGLPRLRGDGVAVSCARASARSSGVTGRRRRCARARASETAATGEAPPDPAGRQGVAAWLDYYYWATSRGAAN
jgi:hypothetical protein